MVFKSNCYLLLSRKMGKFLLSAHSCNTTNVALRFKLIFHHAKHQAKKVGNAIFKVFGIFWYESNVGVAFLRRMLWPLNQLPCYAVKTGSYTKLRGNCQNHEVDQTELETEEFLMGIFFSANGNSSSVFNSVWSTSSFWQFSLEKCQMKSFEKNTINMQSLNSFSQNALTKH